MLMDSISTYQEKSAHPTPTNVNENKLNSSTKNLVTQPKKCQWTQFKLINIFYLSSTPLNLEVNAARFGAI